MPADFLACVRAKGSKVRTKVLAGGYYIHGCKRSGSNSWVWGERKKKKSA